MSNPESNQPSNPRPQAQGIDPRGRSPRSAPRPTAPGWGYRFACLAIALAATLGVVAPPAHAAGPAKGPATGPAAVESSPGTAIPLPAGADLESRIRTLEADTGMDPAAKGALIEQYRRALAALESAAVFKSKVAEYTLALERAPGETAAVRAPLADSSGKASAPEPPPKGLSDEELAQRLAKLQTDIALQEARLADLEKRIAGAGARPAEARARILEVRQALEQVEAELARPAVAEGSADLRQATLWALAARREAQLAEIRATEQELATQEVRDELDRARRDRGAWDLERLKARLATLESMQAERRKAEAERARQETEAARRDAADKHPLVQEAAAESTEITDALARLAEAQAGLAEELDRIERERKRVEEELRAARQRVEAAGLGRTLGQVLIDRRSRLPDLRDLRRDIAEREDLIADATLAQIRYREEERSLRDPEAVVEDLTASDPTAQTPQVRAELAELLAQRKPLLDKAGSAEDVYARKLGELNDAATQWIRATEVYDDFLAEHLLWVRSVAPVGIETLIQLPAGAAWLLSPAGWSEAAQVLAYESIRSPLTWLGWLAVVLLVWQSASIRRAIAATAEPLRRVRTDRFLYTLKAMGLTLVAALPLPLLILLLGRELSLSLEATGFTRAIGRGLIDVSLGFYFLRAFRLLCIPGGVADRHFRWSGRVLARIRGELRWFTAVIVPVAFVASAFYHHNDPVHNAGFGRLAVIVVMLAVAVLFARLFNPRTGVFQGVLAGNPEGWPNRLRNLWLALVVGSPLALAGLTLMGFLYTAGTLFHALVQTAWLALGLTVVQQTVVRWLMLTRRRLALQAALERQAARRAQSQEGKGESGPKETAGLGNVEEPGVDLATLDEQTRRLVNALVVLGAILAIWWIWSPMLPAFNMLEQFSLWHYTATVDGAARQIPVSVADVGLVLAILLVALIAARNLPGLIEIVLLEATSVSAGGRYAVKTLMSYGITAVAVLSAFGTLGLSWSQVQWLVAALGVGIGFGLQEIVANFISGLIILFERPVRVGDVVTVGDTTGVVTNIQIRATTIRNWDRQELLVPNKELITGRLLNWTLTDQSSRIVITIGIEYGSDTDRALALLSQVAAANPRVLADPPPLVTFEGFGDNSLQVVLRCYVESLDYRLGVISELHGAIEKTFSDNGIVIAFPQRDIHLTAREPLDIRLRRTRPARDAGGESAPTSKDR